LGIEQQFALCCVEGALERLPARICAILGKQKAGKPADYQPTT
jgi:hypothetical protein